MTADAAQAPQTGLAHTLRPRHVAMIAFGGIIGAGLFVGGSGAIGKGGPGVCLTYAACGLLVFLIMRMLGEMAVARPGLGSFAEYSALGLGRWAAFVTGWLYWYFWVFTVGAETVAGSKLLIEAGIDMPIWLLGAILVGLMTVTNLLSVRAYGELEFWFSLLKVSAIGVFIAIGIAFIVVFGPGTGEAITTLTSHGGILPHGIDGLCAAVPVVIFSMMGSEVATIAAAESADPAANVARAARTVALRILFFYVFSILVIVMIVPWDSLVVGLSPFEPALDAIGIPGSSQVMSVIIITAVLSCLNSGLYVTSRMLYELARNGDAPRFLAETARNKVPAVGILIGCAAGFAAALAQIYMKEDVFTLLASTSGDIILFVYLIIAVAQIRERRRLEAQGVELKLKMWFFPWLSYAVVAGIIGVVVLLAFIPDQRMTLLLSLGTLAVVLAALALTRQKRQARAAA
ncbi:MAG TPA: amino acid permease [Stellaceae bacterium]|nr:amino acid permease [Stellaceae bacterium]